jgi:RNA polymerase sigma-70 factor (ECF subfamily)
VVSARPVHSLPPDDPSHLNDLALIRAAGGGDNRAFAILIDRHAQGMFRVAYSLSRNRADAEDVVQETFMAAYRGMRRFAGRSTVKTWLTQILLRRAARAWHRGRHHRVTVSLDSSPWAASYLGRAPAAEVDSKLDVTEMLKSLTRPHREVMVLREIQGLSYAEMARVLKLPQGTVESRLARARAALRNNSAPR